MPEQSIGFKLSNINILNKSIKTPSNPGETKKFNFNINVQQSANKKQRLVHVSVQIEVLSIDMKNSYGYYEAVFFFEFESLDDFISDTTLELPEQVVSALNSISFSTMRGLMFEAFRGTFLHSAILPLIDPKSLEPALIQ